MVIYLQVQPRDGWVRLWNPQTGQLIRTIRSIDAVSVVFKNDGSILTYDVKNPIFLKSLK